MGLLHFDIDADGLEQIILDLGATEKQVKFAMSRALARTATTLRTMAARKLKDELALRTISLLRKRLKSLRLRVSGGNGMTLWFGLNDMPASWFKGTPKKTADGASMRGHDIKGGFVAKSEYKKRRTVFKRIGKGRLPIAEQLLPITDKAQVIVEDEIFVQVETIFWKNFERELRARVKYHIGEK